MSDVSDPRDPFVALVEEDVASVLADAFPGTFSVPEPFADRPAMENDEARAIPWRWQGQHTGEFHGLRRTGQPVDVVGVTIVRSSDGEEPVFHRVVDWLALYQQIGAVVATRRPDLPVP